MRLMLRKKKAAQGYVRMLQPVVRGQTSKYNTKLRLGRGFTYEELLAGGVSPMGAKRFRIAYDRRRVNRCEATFAANVERIKAYVQKVTRTDAKGKKRLDFELMATGDAEQPKPCNKPSACVEVDLTAEMLAFDAHAALRKQWIDSRPKKEDKDSKGKKGKARRRNKLNAEDDLTSD